MPLFGTKCSFCGKTKSKNDCFLDSESGKYFCSEEHSIKSKELIRLTINAREKGLVLCDNCLKEIKPGSYVCKHCGKVLVVINEYDINGMCPFTQVKLGGTKFGAEEYYWQHTKCIKNYCALWNTHQEKCGLLTK